MLDIRVPRPDGNVTAALFVSAGITGEDFTREVARGLAAAGPAAEHVA
jgi:hypothetical protein